MDVSRRSVVSAGFGTALSALSALSAPSAPSGPAPVPDPAQPRAIDPEEYTYWAADLFSGRRTSHRADVAHPVLTLSGGLALGSLLHAEGTTALADVVRWSRTELVGDSPVCAWHLDAGLDVAGLGDASLRRADATATNLLLTRAGGPAAVTAFCRDLGDESTRLDRSAPDSCNAAPWDRQDTTTATALARTYGVLLLGSALTPSARDRLRDLLPRHRLAGGWSLRHAFGAGRYGTAALVGTAHRERREVLLAITRRRGQPATFGSRGPLLQAAQTLLRGLDRDW